MTLFNQNNNLSNIYQNCLNRCGIEFENIRLIAAVYKINLIRGLQIKTKLKIEYFKLITSGYLRVTV